MVHLVFYCACVCRNKLLSCDNWKKNYAWLTWEILIKRYNSTLMLFTRKRNTCPKKFTSCVKLLRYCLSVSLWPQTLSLSFSCWHNCHFVSSLPQELELRIETQKQTLASRDESIKKLMEAMQSKGISNKMLEEERIENDRLRTRNIELETRLRHMESVAEIKEKDALRVRNI